MYKRTVFTTITPLPPYITRETVIETLHNHREMIELNPLVIKFDRCKPATFCPPDEFHCTWYELTDKISYLPGGIVTGNVSYKGCFFDLPRGLQTHVYAPLGLDIRDKWTVCGNMPGEPRETVELGLKDAPREGLYLREDIDMRSQIWSTAFVKRTLKRAHGMLVERLVHKADRLREQAAAAQGNRTSSASFPHRQDTIQSPLPSDSSTVYSGSMYSAQSPTASEFGGSYHDSRMRPAPLGFQQPPADAAGLRMSGAPAGYAPQAAEMQGSPALSSGPVPPVYQARPQSATLPTQPMRPEIRVNDVPEWQNDHKPVSGPRQNFAELE